MQWCACRPRSRCDQSRLRMLRGRKACGQTQVSRPARSQSTGRISHAIRCSYSKGPLGAWHGYAMACMAMDCPSQKQTHTRGPDRGQDRPEARAGARLMQLASGAAITCGAVSCTVCTCTHVVQAGVLRIVYFKYATPQTRAGNGTVFSFDSGFACDALGSDWAGSDSSTPDSSR